MDEKHEKGKKVYPIAFFSCFLFFRAFVIDCYLGRWDMRNGMGLANVSVVGNKEELSTDLLRYITILLLATAVAVALGVKMSQPCSSEETISIYNAATGDVEKVNKVCRTDGEWKKLLTTEQYEVTRLKGTEAPFSKTCAVPMSGESGIYQCVCCGTDLFKYDTKFESGTGWPSFWEPVSKLNIRYKPDDSRGRHRTEVLCARCGAHLGHVFDDGPPPTGKRFCINSVAIRLAKSAFVT